MPVFDDTLLRLLVEGFGLMEGAPVFGFWFEEATDLPTCADTVARDGADSDSPKDVASEALDGW